MIFGWIDRGGDNRSLNNICLNITEYTTVELLNRGIDVRYYRSISDAIADSVNFYAYIGTLFDVKIYKDSNLNQLNVNTSEYCMIDQDNIYDNIPRINSALMHTDYFQTNTEQFDWTYEPTADVFDFCVCSAAGDTAIKVAQNVNLSSEAVIYVVDISSVSLMKCEELLQSNGCSMDKFKFISLDLFNLTQISEFLKQFKSGKGLWFASNIFNYLTTSLIYNYQLRLRIQQDFIKLLVNQPATWFVSMFNVNSVLIKNKSASSLLVCNPINLKVLPWL
jgi:hypothetical protein